jgi:hypothetical protein
MQAVDNFGYKGDKRQNVSYGKPYTDQRKNLPPKDYLVYNCFI